MKLIRMLQAAGLRYKNSLLFSQYLNLLCQHLEKLDPWSYKDNQEIIQTLLEDRCHHSLIYSCNMMCLLLEKGSHFRFLMVCS